MQCGLISRVEEPKSRQIILRELILPERSRAENAEKMICCFWSKSSGCVPFVMLEASCHLAASDPQNTTGPDLFGFYTREVTDLLSQDEDILPSSRDTEAANASTRMLDDGKGTASYVNPLFGSSLEAALPDFRRGLLKVLLRQSLSTLVQEVDEMLNPVIRIRQMLSILRYTKQNSRLEAIPGPGGEGSYRRLKISTSSSAASMPVQESLVYYGLGKEESGTEDMHSRSFSTGILDKGTTGMTKCAHCGTSETPQWRWGADRRKICNACGLRLAKGKNPSPVEGRKRKMPLHFSKADVEEAGEVNEDFRFLLETGNSLQLEETMKKHSDELSQKLRYMEQQLEELIDSVVSKCRQMTPSEKQLLRKQIQNLHPKNLERVVEIICRKKPTESPSPDEMFIDLEKQENITLWRLYFYVKAVENATKLSTYL